MKKMFKKSKKGFTLVELVVVIAVIAILGGVSIAAYLGITNKANESNDVSMVQQLNTALIADKIEHTHPTMYDALQVAKREGIDLTKVKASAKDNEILWDSVNDLFCYYKGGEKFYYPSQSTQKVDSEVKFWVVSDQMKDDRAFSTYYIGSETEITTSKGFDAGETNLTKVTYTNQAKQDVVIRTNGEYVEITAPNDTIHHYGIAKQIDVKEIAPSDCYHEHGTVKGQLNIEKGKVILESEANVGFVNVTATSSSAITLQINSGSEFGRLTCENETVLNEVAQASGVPAAKTMKTVEGTIAIVKNAPYTSLSAAKAAFTEENSVFELFTDIVSPADTAITLVLPKNGDLNGRGYTLSGNVNVSADKGGKIHNIFFENIHNNSSRSDQAKDRYGIDLVGTLSCIYSRNVSGNVEIYNCSFNNADWDMIQLCPFAGASLSIHNNVFRTSNPDVYGQIRWIHIQSAQNVDFSASITNNDFYDVKNLRSSNGQAVEVYYPVDASKLVINGNYFDGIKSASDVSKEDLDLYYACIGTGGTSYNNANSLVFNGIVSTPNNK